MALQTLDAFTEIVLLSAPDPTRASPLSNAATLAILVPLSIVFSAISNAATFAFLSKAHSSERPIRQAFGLVFSRFGKLLRVESIIGPAVVVGMLLVIPGIYFMAVFTFVPCLVIAKNYDSAFAYIGESRQLARRFFWPLILLSTVVTILSVTMTEIAQSLGRLAGPLAVGSGLADSGHFAAVLAPALAVILSALVNTFVATAFLHLTSRE